MSRRFFVPELDPRAPLVALTADEARHVGRVLRLGPGAIVSVFDGRGHEWEAEVADVARDRATLRLTRELQAAPETRIPIALAIAVLKGEKMDDVVRDAVMLGVVAIRPILTTRTEVSVTALARGRRAERWRRIAVASAKQCGRAVVPPIDEPMTLDEAVSTPASATRLVLVEPGASAISTRDLRDIDPPTAAQVLIGPEGGWTEDELRRCAEAGAVGLRLGGRTLRADAMPLVALTALLTAWDEL